MVSFDLILNYSKENWCEFRSNSWMGWVYELHITWESNSKSYERRSILFKTTFNYQHFDYLKPGIEDPGYTRPDCHDDMISKIIRLKETKILEGEKTYRTSKFITVGYSSRIISIILEKMETSKYSIIKED